MLTPPCCSKNICLTLGCAVVHPRPLTPAATSKFPACIMLLMPSPSPPTPSNANIPTINSLYHVRGLQRRASISSNCTFGSVAGRPQATRSPTDVHERHDDTLLPLGWRQAACLAPPTVSLVCDCALLSHVIVAPWLHPQQRRKVRPLLGLPRTACHAASQTEGLLETVRRTLSSPFSSADAAGWLRMHERVNYISGCNSVCRFRTRSCNNACEVVDRRPWGPLIHRVFDCLQSVGQLLQSVGEGAEVAFEIEK